MMLFRSAYDVNRWEIRLGFVCNTFPCMNLKFGRNIVPQRIFKNLCGVTYAAHCMPPPPDRRRRAAPRGASHSTTHGRALTRTDASEGLVLRTSDVTHNLAGDALVRVERLVRQTVLCEHAPAHRQRQRRRWLTCHWLSYGLA
jgi:hypothetical protein